DGVRQDFVISQKPEGAGELRIKLNVTGARVEQAEFGARLVLENSGRNLAYSRLRVVDASGRDLPAQMEIAEGSVSERAVLAVVVDDKDATYPIRIEYVASLSSTTTAKTARSGRNVSDSNRPDVQR